MWGKVTLQKIKSSDCFNGKQGLEGVLFRNQFTRLLLRRKIILIGKQFFSWRKRLQKANGFDHFAKNKIFAAFVHKN